MTTREAQTTYAKKIAATLSEELQPYQMVAKVGMRQRDNLLHVAVEPSARVISQAPVEPSASGAAFALETSSARLLAEGDTGEGRRDEISNVINQKHGLTDGDSLALAHPAEPSSVPDPRLLLPALKQTLKALNLNWLKLAKVSGRLPGQMVPLWQEELLFQTPAPVAKTLMRPEAVMDLGDVTASVGGHHPGGQNGQLSGQLIIGSHNQQDYTQYTYNVAHGGVLNVASAPTVTPRPMPLSLKPPRFDNLLDRRAVLPVLCESLRQQQPVELYSDVGFGKTSLMRHLAHDDSLTSAFPDGVVYLSAHRQLAADLLQSLYDAFHETGVPLKPSYGKVQQALSQRRALVILNGLSLEKEETDWLMAALPASTFVLVSQVRLAWQEGAAIALKGLPLPESMTLIQNELGRVLADAEKGAAKALWKALAGNPLQLRRAAAQVKGSEMSLVDLIQSLPGQTISRHMLFRTLATKLPERHRSALALMGAMGGVALSADQVCAIAQVPEAGAVLQNLADLHLVEATATGYQLYGDLITVVQQAFDPLPWLTSATNYFVTGAGQSDTDAMMHVLAWTQRTGQWRPSLALVRRLDPLLSLSGCWDQWQQALRCSLQSAEQLGNVAAEAWSLHQLGTRALALGDIVRADGWLSRALRLRQHLGDRAGAAVTRHNLGLIGVPLVVGDGAVPVALSPSPSRGGRVKRWLWPWSAVGLLALSGIGGIAYGLWPEQSRSLFGKRSPVSFSAEDIVFGARELNSGSEPKGIILRNTSEQPLTIQQVLLSGAGDFELAADADASETVGTGDIAGCQSEQVLAVGEDCTISATFTPTTVGEHRGDIVVVTTVEVAEGGFIEARSKSVDLVGRGTPQSVPSLSFGMPSLNFPQTGIGTTSLRSLNIMNDGSAPLEIAFFDLLGRRSDAFAIEEEDCTAGPLAPNGSCNLTLVFQPASIGVRTVQLAVQSNVDEDTELSLTGTGVDSNVPNAGLNGVDVSPPSSSPGTLSAPSPSQSPSAPSAPPAPSGDPGTPIVLAENDRAAVSLQSTVVIDVLANDSASDGSLDTATITAVSQGDYGSVETDGRQVTYVHSGQPSITDSFTYTVETPSGESATGTVTISVEDARPVTETAPGLENGNRDPVAIDYAFTIPLGEALTFDLLREAYDPDPGDEVRLSTVTTLDGSGRLENNGDGTVTYVPSGAISPDQQGKYVDRFQYVLSDGHGGEAQGIISIAVIVSPQAEQPAIRWQDDSAKDEVFQPLPLEEVPIESLPPIE